MHERAVGPCRFSHSAAISACASATAWQHALSALTGPEAQDLDLDLIVVSAALSACEKASRWHQATQLLQEAERREIHPDVVALNAVISSCGKGFAWARALDLLQSLADRRLQPTRISYSSALTACERSGRWRQAMGLWHGMKSAGVTPDAIAVGASISAMEKGRQWAAALWLLSEEERSSRCFDTVAFNAGIAACAKSREWIKALDILQTLTSPMAPVRPDTASFDAGMDACADGHWLQALELLRGMAKLHLPRTARSYMAALSACTSSSHWPCSLALWAELQEEGRIPIDGSLRSAAIEACSPAGLWQEALHYFLSSGPVAASDDALRRGVIKVLAHAAQTSQAVALYRLLEEEKLYQPWKTANLLDLHGMTVEVALMAMFSALLTRALEDATRPPLGLIVGRGLHSEEGVAILKPVLQEVLSELGVPWKEVTDGRIYISAAETLSLADSQPKRNLAKSLEFGGTYTQLQRCGVSRPEPRPAPSYLLLASSMVFLYVATFVVGFAAIALWVILNPGKEEKLKGEDSVAEDDDIPLNEEPWIPTMEVKDWTEAASFESCPWNFGHCESVEDVLNCIWKTPVPKDLHVGFDAMQKSVKGVSIAYVKLGTLKEIHYCILYTLRSGAELFGGAPSEQTAGP
ncbi:MRL1 [Symbiodinium microadriaticum]|nr:MRL1 [Symbiodinium microadriaticum]